MVLWNCRFNIRMRFQFVFNFIHLKKKTTSERRINKFFVFAFFSNFKWLFFLKSFITIRLKPNVCRLLMVFINEKSFSCASTMWSKVMYQRPSFSVQCITIFDHFLCTFKIIQNNLNENALRSIVNAWRNLWVAEQSIRK